MPLLGLPPVLFKKLKHSLTTPLTLIYNELLQFLLTGNGKRPTVVPVFKKGSTASVVNYRPISLTSVLSKILERILVAKIIDHLHANGLVSPEQHGFLKRCSTCTNLLDSQNDWTLNIELGFQAAVVYIDFAKAFDTVSQKRLFVKLHAYGIRGTFLSWLLNFFSDRTHQTKINSSLSEPENLLSGVIQGSGIGPIMFVMFINDLVDSSVLLVILTQMIDDPSTCQLPYHNQATHYLIAARAYIPA